MVVAMDMAKGIQSSKCDTSGPKARRTLLKLWNQAPTKVVPCFPEILLIYHELFPGMPDSVTKSSIDHTVCLLAYNKKEIKQYGCCMLKVNYSGKTILLPFFIVNSKFKQ